MGGTSEGMGSDDADRSEATSGDDGNDMIQKTSAALAASTHHASFMCDGVSYRLKLSLLRMCIDT